MISWPEPKLPPINLWSLPWWIESSDTGVHYDIEGRGNVYEKVQEFYKNRKKDG